MDLKDVGEYTQALDDKGTDAAMAKWLYFNEGRIINPKED
jgi:hypothetical protein